jgi:flotillin
VLNLAEAEKQRLIAEAEGRAQATRMQGEAEADIIFKKGEAEAKAMGIKAEAYQEFNQAAVVDKLITSLPEVVRAMAQPLSNVDKITIVSTAEIAAQVPALFESLSGMSITDLLSKVRLIGDKAPKPSPEISGDGPSTGKAKGAAGS